MILSRSYASCLLVSAFCVAPLTASSVSAGDYITEMPVNRIADHCARFGQGFVDVGNGMCGRVTAHVRVYVGTRNAAMNEIVNPWANSNGTSSAALRSDSMVPGAAVTHLRVRGSLDSFDPFH